MIPNKKPVIDEKWIREAYNEAGSYFSGMYNLPLDSNQNRLVLANLGIWLTVCPRCRTTSIHKISEETSEPEFITAEWNPDKYLREAKAKVLPMRFKCTVCGGTFEVRQIEPKAEE